MGAIREALKEYGLNDKDLDNNIIPDLEELLRKGKFEELPTRMAEILRRT